MPPSRPAASREWRWLAVLLTAAFAVKLVVLLQLKNHPLLQTNAGLDTTTYAALAERVANGDVLLGPGVYFVSPLYIYFCALIVSLGGSFVAVRFVQIVLGTAAVYLVYVAAREWFGVRAAWCAAALAALTGTFTFYEVLLIQAALDPFLIAASLASLALASTRDRPRWYFVAGICFGLATLNRPNVLVAAIVAATAPVAAFRKRDAAAIGSRLAPVTLGIVVALSPVSIRNGVVAGDWSPLPSQGGLNFYIGNNPVADGTYRPVPGIRPTIEGQETDTRDVASRALGHSVTDREASSYFYRQGLDWIRSAPSQAAALFARKVALLFNRAHVFLNYSYPFFAYDARTLLIALPVGAWLLVPLGVFGLVWVASTSSAGSASHHASPVTDHALRTTGHVPRITDHAPRTTNHGRAPLLAFTAVYALTTAAFFVSDRYRLPLLIPMAIGAGAAIDRLTRRVAEKAASGRPERKRYEWVLLGAAALLVNWPMRADDGRPEERARMAERLIQLGDYGEAGRWAALAENGYPRPAVLHVRIGTQFLQAREPRLALEQFERAAALEPGEAEVQYRLGQALLETGRAGEAVPHLRAAVSRNPALPLAGYDLARALASTGDRGGALAVLTRAQPTAESRAQNFVAFGQFAMQLQDAAIAEAFFRRAVAEAPSLAAAHQQLGLALGIQNRLSEAATELSEAVRLNPGDATTHLNLAVVRAQSGDFQQARAEAEEALRLAPEYVQARQLLAALPRIRH